MDNCKIISISEANQIARDNFFCAGFLADNTSVLLVHDKNTDENWICKKFPGGRNNEYAFYDTIFEKTIKKMLLDYEYSHRVIGDIMEFLKNNPMSPIQRTVTLEYLEETTLFPFFDLTGSVVYNQRPDKKNRGVFFNQFYFIIDSYVDNLSADINDKKTKPEDNDFTFMRPVDEDVKSLQVYMFEDIPKTILPSHLPVFRCLLAMKANKMDKDFMYKYMHLMS